MHAISAGFANRTANLASRAFGTTYFGPAKRTDGDKVSDYIEKSEINLQFSDLRTLFEYANDAIFLFEISASNEPGKFRAVNQVACERLGYTRDELLGYAPQDLTAAERLKGIPNLMAEIQHSGRITFEGGYRHKQGHQIPLEFSVCGVTLQGQKFALSMARDITRRQAVVQALKESESRYRSLVDVSPDMIAVIRGYEIAFVNAAGARLLGLEAAEDLIGASILDFIHPDYIEVMNTRKDALELHHGTVPALEEQFIRVDGITIDVDVLGAHVDYQGHAARLVVVRDITERKRAEKAIYQMAYYDSLTGLPNRRLFQEQLATFCEKAKETQDKLAVLFLDLDRFKLINDSFGHQDGDALLKQVASRLTDVLPAQACAARLGGDEFTIILPSVSERNEVSATAQKIVDSLDAKPFYLAGQEIYVSSSIGISLFPEDARCDADLLALADMAMYRTKKQGRNHYQFYNAVMNNAGRAAKLIHMGQSLRKAVERDELYLEYQPKIDTCSGAMIGLEALLRWNHPEIGRVSPQEFIPIAEETGLIVPIGEWVLTTVCRQVRTWFEAGMSPVRVAINLSVRQFQESNLVETVERVLQDTGLDGKWLEFEITESMVMHNTHGVVESLHALKRLGVTISVDDFGTGYSFLSYLRQLPIDSLKIDQTFVQQLSDQSSAQITTAMIQLAHSLNIRVIAEGVETEEQRVFLSSNSCDEMQGFLFSRPLLPANVADMLAC